MGLADEVIDLCFAGTASRIKGVGFDILAEEALMRHHLGYPDNPERTSPDLPNPGLYHWRRTGKNMPGILTPLAAFSRPLARVTKTHTKTSASWSTVRRRGRATCAAF